MAYHTGVLDTLRDFGINFTEEPGCRTRGSINFSPRGPMAHHTGADRDITWMLRDGRPGLSGPLCNFELRRHGHVHVVALGRANHAGRGSYRGVSGNSAWWGIEATSAGKLWTPGQRDMYPLLAAALCAYCRTDESWLCGHKEYAGFRGKWDPGNWDMGWHRNQTGFSLRHRRPPPPPKPLRLGDRLIGLGDRGPDVAEWQRILRIPDDGAFGPQTHGATQAFQRQHGLVDDGIVGPATLRAARPQPLPPRPPQPPPPPPPIEEEEVFIYKIPAGHHYSRQGGIVSWFTDGTSRTSTQAAIKQDKIAEVTDNQHVLWVRQSNLLLGLPEDHGPDVPDDVKTS